MSVTPRFTPEQYPLVSEALTLVKTVTVDCSPTEPMTEDEFDELAADEEAMVYLDLNGDHDFHGNLHPGWIGYGDDDYEKFTAKRFKSFVQEDGEIGLEIKFVLARPFDGHGKPGVLEANARVIYDATKLGELISFEDFVTDLKNDEDWTFECFGVGGECYGLIFEVTRPGFNEDDVSAGEMGEYLTKLWVQYKGKKKNIHVGLYQD